MDNQEKRYYKYFLNSYSHNDSLSVGWGTKEKQESCYKSLLKIYPHSFNYYNQIEEDILDVGCGVGHLIDYLNVSLKRELYTGIDCIEETIEAAKELHPDHNFECIELKDYKKKHDYVIACGSFNYNTGNNAAEIKNNIKHMYELANKGISFNLMSTSVPYDKRKPDLFYYDPIHITHYIYMYYKKITLITNYADDDFTIHIIK